MGHQQSHQIKTAETTHHKSSAASVQPPLPTRASLHPILQLQRQIGNRAVSQLIQAKLKIGQPGDVYEQEADRIADLVMAPLTDPAVSGVPPRIQRFSGQPTGQTGAPPASVAQALASPGRPLEYALRKDMEQRFDHDFSGVRVHSGAIAEQSARDVNAHAYTVGQDIVFSTGQFAPETNKGQQLIAHELAHVVQQRGTAGVIQRQPVKPDEKSKFDFMLANVEGRLQVVSVNRPTQRNSCRLSRRRQSN